MLEQTLTLERENLGSASRGLFSLVHSLSVNQKNSVQVE